MSASLTILPLASAKIMGRYLYAIVDIREPFSMAAERGVDDAETYLMKHQGIAAVVSDIPTGKIRPERRRLSAHHHVLTKLMESRTVLPVAFGLIADPDEVDQFLELNHDELIDQLDRVAGKIEMGLRVVWDVPNIYEYLVGMHPELRALRDHTFRGDREPTHDEKIELGRAFDRMLNHDREILAERASSIVRSRCVEVVFDKTRSEHEIMNLACLIDRDGRKDFELAVIETARLFDDNFAFDFNGPWPPHHFVDVEPRF